MRITLLAHGTRGDVWPMVALGWHLTQREHEVTVAIPGEFKALAEGAGLATAPMPFDLVAFLASERGQRLLHTGGVRFARALTREYARRADAIDDACLAAADGAQALVGSILTGGRALALAERLEVPLACVYQQPVARSREYASMLLSRGRLRSGVLRWASHGLARWLWQREIASETHSFRRRLGLSAQSEMPFDRMEEMRCLGLHIVGPTLFPRPSDWGEHLKITGTWEMPAAVRGSLGEDLPGDLQAWLDDGEPPIFLGFGSMPVIEPGALYRDILDVTAALDRRAVLSANCVPPDAVGSLPQRLRVVGAVDHDSLFPRCAAVVHHGGIGSTTASLRAGRPTMVCSVFSDQPWWGERLRRMGVGTHLPFAKLSRDRLRQGLQLLLDPAVAVRARELGARIQAEGDGLPEATQMLEDRLSDATPPASPGSSQLMGAEASTPRLLAHRLSSES